MGGQLMLLALLIGLSPHLAAQTYSDSYSDTFVGGPYNFTNSGSDYKVNLSWTTAFRASNQNFCDCHSNTELLEFGTVQGENNRSAVWSVGDAADNNGSSGDIILGPGYSDTWYIFTKADGQDNFIVNCGIDCDARAWSGGGLFVRTAPFIKPANFSASSTEAEGSRLRKIVLEWGKGTDFPEGYTQYRIYRKLATAGSYPSTPLITLGGDARSWEDTGVLPNTAYDYKITTYSTYNQRLASAGNDGIAILQAFSTLTWGTLESSGSFDRGQTLTVNLMASDGTYKNRVKLEWNKVSTSADNIRVERSLPGSNPVQYEELGILNKHATAYTDNDALPGYEYTYRVSPLDGDGNALQLVEDPGFMKPNGIVRGQVRALGGAGVQGISICVLPLNPVSPAGKYPVPNGGYCTTTDAGGNYEIRNIYYYDSASFVVNPSYPNHIFGPPSKVVVLDLVTNIQPGIDFTDSTSISIFGKVHFPPASTFGATGSNLIGLRNAKVLLDTLDRGIRTDGNGNWSYAVTNPGTYKFNIEYEGHDFDADPAFADLSGDTAVVTVNDQDITGVDFEDQNVDSVLVKVVDGCGDPLAVTANANGSTPRVRIRSERGPLYFEKFVSMSSTGFGKVVLPATNMWVKAQDDPSFANGNVAAQLTDTTMKFELATRDSSLQVVSDTILDITPSRTVVINGTPVTLPPDTVFNITNDTSYLPIQPRADFVYFGPFDININFTDAGADVYPGCLANGLGGANDSIILMEVGGRYGIQVEIFDQFSGCAVDTGAVLVYDYVGDKERDPANIPIKKGNAFYVIEGGEPNVATGGANPFQKLFFVSVQAGVRPPEDKGWWILLQGAKELTPTFTSRSPEIPDLIIHDPPGDNSYAWVEKGSEYSSFSTTEREISGSGGLYGDMIIGGKGKSALGLGVQTLFDVGAGAKIVFEYDIGRENFDKAGYRSTYSFTETFSTSDDPLFTGYEGDVYVGKALNQLWSVAKVLEFNSSTCTSTVEDKPNLEAGGIATTFIYTEKHIKNVLVPQLEYLAGILGDQADQETNPTRKSELRTESDSFRIDVFNWNQILAKNAQNRDANARYVRNQSFSAGATYQLVEEYNEEATNSFEYVDFVDEELRLGVAWEIEGNGLWTEGDAGFAAQFRTSFTKEEGNDTTNTFVVGYELADKDIGDFFSVDILKDTAYNVPAFRIFAGTSSCPQEEGTQARDRANLNVFPPRVDNVPVGGKATFTAQLINESESQETREYQLRVIPQTNPGGAVVTLGGQNISNRPISYFLEAFDANTEADLTVEAGPKAANYSNIGIMMYPPCEYELWENNGNLINGDTFYITVNFQSECSNVTLRNPTDNWLVNANNNDLLAVDFTGYDLNNPFLESLTLEYKPDGLGWQEALEVPRDSLNDLIKRKLWDVSGVPDGNYQIRARANCGSGRGFTVSTPLNGIVDRNSFAPFGIPTPSDGFLRLGQVISVQFDKDIDCGFTNIPPSYGTFEASLLRTDDSTFIPVTVSCRAQEDRLILNPSVNLFNMPDLEGVTLVARVIGIQDPQQNVQKYPVAWAFQVNASPVFWDPDSLVTEGPALSVTSISSTLKNQALLTKAFEITDYPEWLTPSVLSGAILAEGDYEIEFAVDPELPPGIYRDTVIAMVDGWPELLDITYEALAVPPNWSVDPSRYQHSMTVVAVFSLDNTDTNLSRDDRDLIAAVVNGEVRGVANLEYVPLVDKYIAFLQVHSNAQFGETVSFRMWHALTGFEYGAVETFTFGTDIMQGRIQSPTILHPSGIFQVIPLDQGWNWVSFNMDAPNWSREKVLESIMSVQAGNQIALLNKAGQLSSFSQASPPYTYLSAWSGNLTQLNNREMFLLYLSDNPDTLRVLGTPVTTPPSIPISSGWNWISYPVATAKPTEEAMASFPARNYDIVKGQEQFAEYLRPSQSWYGTLKFMEPGKGYKFYARNARSNSLQFPAREGREAYQVHDHKQYESHMALIAKIEMEGVELAPGRLLAGAFIDDTCRGVTEVIYVPELNEYRVLMGIHGNATDLGREVSFRIFDTYTDEEVLVEKNEFFAVERLLGTPQDPYLLLREFALSESAYQLRQNVPNPYDSRTSISYLLPKTEQISLTVYDQYGKVVKVLVDNEEQAAGEHRLTFDASDLPAGVYHYSLRAGAFRASRKMVKF
jgi:hypothetical protein